MRSQTIAQTIAGLLGEGNGVDTVSRFRCVDDQKAAGFPVSAACEAAGVSTSGYYDWHNREAVGPTERQVAEAELVELMRAVFEAAEGNFGVPRMHRELRRAGQVVNKKRVHRLMRKHGMAGRHHRRRCRTTFPGPDGYTIPDLVGRCFAVGRPDVAWCQDITYIATGEGWLFLASVLDLGSRRLLGYAMAEHMRTELVLDALGMAVAARGGDHAVHGVIVHADRGSQYTSNDYLDWCQDQTRQLRPSVGRTAVCWDNAVVESFWSSLKREALQGRVFATRADARRAVFKWINWYNTKRLHSSLNYVPPLEWEQQYRQAS
jgi:transposase InsO family protein